MVFELSVELKWNFKNALARANTEKHLVIWRKHIYALPLLACRVGNVYQMEQSGQLRLIDILANGIAFMLISYKKIR